MSSRLCVGGATRCTFVLAITNPASSAFAKLPSPLLYAAVVVPMFLVGGFVAGKLSLVVDCYMIFMAFPPDRPFLFGSCLAGEALVGLAAVSPVFVLTGAAIVRMERPGPPGIIDHLRHCSILYAGLPFPGYGLLTYYETQSQALAWGLGAAALFGVGAQAVVVDALVLYVAWRRQGAARL